VSVRIYTFKWPSYLSALLVGLLILYLGAAYHTGLREKQVYEVMSWTTLSQRIIIDPGHGGMDPGAIGPGGALEKEINLQVALQLAKILRQAGAEVMLIRENDRDFSTSPKGYAQKKQEDLKARVEMINQAGGDMLISIHANSFPTDKWSGGKTFYERSSPEGKELAKAIQQSLNNIMGNTDRKEKPIDAYLLNKTDTLGVIVEVGFISNPQEEKLLQNTAYQEKLAWAIYNGIAKYLANNLMR
jgi:N-acetylmuramoyl-L-alanine amidase